MNKFGETHENWPTYDISSNNSTRIAFISSWRHEKKLISFNFFLIMFSWKKEIFLNLTKWIFYTIPWIRWHSFMFCLWHCLCFQDGTQFVLFSLCCCPRVSTSWPEYFCSAFVYDDPDFCWFSLENMLFTVAIIQRTVSSAILRAAW